MAVQYLDKRNGEVLTTTQIATKLTNNFIRMKELQEELNKLANDTAVLNEQLVKAVIRGD